MLKITLLALGPPDTISFDKGSSRLFRLIIDRELPQPIRREAMAEIRRQVEKSETQRASNAKGILRYFTMMKGEDSTVWAREELAKLRNK